jgi:predicted transcriptional regulator
MKEQIAEIVAAYVRKNHVDPAALPELIRSVSQSLAALGRPSAEPTSLVPAVPIRRSAGAEAIICLECGFQSQMLKRHLTTTHGTTVDEYRARWSLPKDYPMVAKNYSARRSELAKGFGFGKRLKSARRK